MSHEILKNDKQEGRTMAWHGKTIVNPDLTLANCHLNPNRADDGKPKWDYVGKSVDVDGKPTGFHILGVTDGATTENEDGQEFPLVIGDSYNPVKFKPVTNEKLIEILTPAVAEHGLTLESCGTVKNRGRQFFSFAMVGNEFNAAGRPFNSFFNVGNGNDKSSPLWVNTSNICTVCNNTFTMNMDLSGFVMEVKKTKFSELRITNLGRAIEAMLSGQKEFAAQLNKLAGYECDENKAREFFAGFLATSPDAPLSTRSLTALERLTQLFKAGAGNDGNDFSDVFQAATDFYSHEAASAAGDEAANWKNYVSSEFGAGRKAKQDVWEAIGTEKTRKGMLAIGKKVLKITADNARKSE